MRPGTWSALMLCLAAWACDPSTATLTAEVEAAYGLEKSGKPFPQAALADRIPFGISADSVSTLLGPIRTMIVDTEWESGVFADSVPFTVQFLDLRASNGETLEVGMVYRRGMFADIDTREYLGDLELLSDSLIPVHTRG